MDTTTRPSRRHIALGLTLVTAAAGVALATAGPAAAEITIPDRHAVVCDSATMYRNYDSAIPGPVTYVRTLYRGDGIGHTRGAHRVHNGWANIQDFGPNDWGFIREECIS